MFTKLLTALPRLSRRGKRSILVIYDLHAMALALWAAFSTRLGMLYMPDNPKLVIAALASFIVGVYALYRLHIYHIVLRYFDLRTVTRILTGSAIAAAAWMIVAFLANERTVIDNTSIMVPRSVGFIYCGFLFLLLFMGRYVMALLLSGAAHVPLPSPHARFNVAIYGANSAGLSLANSMRQRPQFRLVTFIDDDPALHGQMMAGVPIQASHELPDISRAEKLSEVFLALPNAARSERLAAINLVTELNLKVRTVPAPEEIVSGRFTVSDVRPVDVSDLLRRDPVQPIGELIREAVQDRSILVTGAGGSIGSEICRQLVKAGPSRIILLDHAEFALYAIDQALGELTDKLPVDQRPIIEPIIGSTSNEFLVRNLIRDYRIDTIYHAAAYKHVPLLEHNEIAGVENNVAGTLNLARAAFDGQLTRFTMISTDKAVRPRSVMGASKRVSELIVQAFANRSGCKTHFGIVRFGNVLDSSGSVVQRFRKQIAQGGPVTVTHKDITRYFMSIPEATQLVLQASAMAKAGEVFVLDMGEPVRIDELARNMIQLSGMSVREEENPNGDIEIHHTGLRPGEKLFEELFIGEKTGPTQHPRIRMATEWSLSLDKLEPQLSELLRLCSVGDASEVRKLLRKLIDAESLEDRATVSVIAQLPHRGLER